MLYFDRKYLENYDYRYSGNRDLYGFELFIGDIYMQRNTGKFLCVDIRVLLGNCYAS